MPRLPRSNSTKVFSAGIAMWGCRINFRSVVGQWGVLVFLKTTAGLIPGSRGKRQTGSRLHLVSRYCHRRQVTLSGYDDDMKCREHTVSSLVAEICRNITSGFTRHLAAISQTQYTNELQQRLIIYVPWIINHLQFMQQIINEIQGLWICWFLQHPPFHAIYLTLWFFFFLHFNFLCPYGHAIYDERQVTD